MDGHSILMMGNHGVLVSANTVAHAFELLYYLERAAQTMVLVYSTGQPLNEMSDDLTGQPTSNRNATRPRSASSTGRLNHDR